MSTNQLNQVNPDNEYKFPIPQTTPRGLFGPDTLFCPTVGGCGVPALILPFGLINISMCSICVTASEENHDYFYFPAIVTACVSLVVIVSWLLFPELRRHPNGYPFFYCPVIVHADELTVTYVE
jgi:hypothetical protein